MAKNMNMLGYVLIIFVIGVMLKIYFESDAFNLKCIISDVDGNKYCVRERPKLKLVANLLATVTDKLKSLVKIKKLVEADLGLDDISKKTRERDYVFARFLYYKVARDVSKSSLSNIGKVVKRDHATALYGISKFDDLVNYNKEFSYLKDSYHTISLQAIDITDNLVDLSSVLDSIVKVQDDLESIKTAVIKLTNESKQNNIRQAESEVGNT